MIGTSRTLTLPGGRRISVPVWEGTQDGQVIRLEGQGEPSSSGGPQCEDVDVVKEGLRMLSIENYPGTRKE